MEATARVPGQPGSAQDRRTAGEHIHQLLGLAESLVRTAVPKPMAPESLPLVSSPLGVDLGLLSDDEAVAWAQNLEQLNRHLQGLLVQAAGELSERVYAGRYKDACSRKPAELLTSSLKLSRAEAARRIRLASHFQTSTDPLTQVATTPSQPILGSALFTGRVSSEQALIVSGFVDEAAWLASSGSILEAQPSELEELLTRQAEDEPADILRILGRHALALLDPDGQKPSEADLVAKQGIFFRNPRNGLVHVDGFMTIRQYEHLMAGIGWSSSPKPRDPESQEAEQNVAEQQDGSNQSIPGVSELLAQLLVTSSQNGPVQPPVQPPVQHPLQPLWTPSTGDDGSTWLKPPPSLGIAERSQGWRKPLAPDDIPPRPPEAPHDATPPRFQGEKWFWFPDNRDVTASNNGWIRPAQGGSPTPGNPVPSPGVPIPGVPIPDAPGPDEAGPDEAGPDEATSTTAPVDAGATAPPETVQSQPWPHLIDGVWVPEPGSNGGLGGLDPIDPNSTDPAVKDRRTHGQKLLDGLISCVQLAARTGQLPMNGGLKSQLYLSVTQADLDKKDGTSIVLAPYSGPVALALFEEDLCTSEVTPLLRDTNGGVLDVGRTQRLFTFAQRKILPARDMGCAYPDCTAPPFWTEAHHIIPWQHGGRTSVDNAVLCCSLHHHYLHDRGWTIRLEGGIAWFTPPYSVDILRRERRNNFHHGRS
ncbi:HNH endonuclease signature motif containing protein [Arthrobacter glacialis]|uniref:HNH endonuclease signature motif containing protein n=1 Tax=Arthrobacter glacialis TaxID=1664 RepID=UPI0013FE4529|nr:HNH endonuclease signature motif containing protein [Arthrobacter glacialis]